MRTSGTILIAVLLLGALATSAPASPIIDWDPAYFWEAGATFDNAPLGSEMKIVGTISGFGAPLSFLNANMPATEYTFYASGLMSLGTATIGSPGSQFYVTTYSAGTIEIYEDATPDAVFDPNPPNANVPSTFTDGTLILSGTLANFSTQTNDFTAHNTGNAQGNITWTGGSLIAYVGGEANPCPAIFTGGLTWYPGTLIPGYLFRHDGKIDHECPTPTRPGTWGRIKSLYR